MPLYADIFEWLGITEEVGFNLFIAFVQIDINQDGRVDVKECFSFIGGRPTKFTQRVFHNQRLKANGDVEIIGLKFIEFVKVLWNFCTMSYYTLAQYIFEIMDVDNTAVLEREDIEAIYRMLYDCPQHDEVAVGLYSFYNNQIIKQDFCKISGHIGITFRNQMLIQPAIDFQRRIHKKIGGKRLWDQLSAHRKKNFEEIDRLADTVPDAMEDIIELGLKQPPRVIHAEMLLEQHQKQFADDMLGVESELRAREEQLAAEERRRKATAEDRFMLQALRNLDQAKLKFEAEEFTTEDVWARHERRMELFQLYDDYVVLAKEYWEWRDDKDISTATGTDDDHEARYQDLVRDPDGKAIHDLLVLLKLFEGLKEVIDEKNKKNKKYNDHNKKDKQILVESNLKECHRLFDALYDPAMSPEATNKLIEKLKIRSFEEENKIAAKYATKRDFHAAEWKAHIELRDIWKERTIKTMQDVVAKRAEERERDYVRDEFKLATTYGSRITRYESSSLIFVVFVVKPCSINWQCTVHIGYVLYIAQVFPLLLLCVTYDIALFRFDLHPLSRGQMGICS